MPNVEKIRALKDKLNSNTDTPDKKSAIAEKSLLNIISDLESQLEEKERTFNGVEEITTAIKELSKVVKIQKPPVVNTKTTEVVIPDKITAVLDSKTIKLDASDIKIPRQPKVEFPSVQKVLNVNELPRQVEIIRDPRTDRINQTRYIYATYDITTTYFRNNRGSITGYVVRKNAR